MEKSDTKVVAEEINRYIQRGLWLDFEVSQYSKNKLIIIGSIDPSNSHNIEIHFEDIFFVSLPMEWKTDTSKTVFQLLEGEDARTVNLRFQVEQGYHIFKFTPEDYADDFGCLIGAKAITYVIVKDNI